MLKFSAHAHEKEPIAIIGIGCRFPGGANGPDAFWRLLRDGVDAITEVPPDRWSVRTFYDPEPGTPGKTYSRWGGFLKGIDQFDAGFFGISPREAASMDPQQRMLLEVAYEAIEDGGQVLNHLAGSNTGVFIGISTTDYAQIQANEDDRDSIDTYSMTGGVMSLAANRISYCFDFKGPSLIVDTACSSSLVAVDMACRSLWDRASDVALAGGVNIIIGPLPYIGFSRLSMLSRAGRCKAFDASADGFVRGEGAGIVVLKPLSRALIDKDPIYAVIRGSAVNQDGRTNGITVPSAEAQAALIREACQRAGVLPEKIQYVEAHGTGTAVGDPIEANALSAVLSANRPDGSNCVIGTVKTNIGHLEAGAGIAGLIKTALALNHGLIPPNLHFNDPNPHIDFHGLKLHVPRDLEPWPANDEPRLAAVNSFGFGGTNAHVILSEAPRREFLSQVSANEPSHRPHLLPLSARSPEALRSLAKAYVDFLKDCGDERQLSLKELAHHLSVRRTHHDHRLSVVVRTKEETVGHLESFLNGENKPGMFSGHAIADHGSRLAFVFSGQGPQWYAMGRELIEEEPVFRRVVERCDELLRPYASWSLMEELAAGEDQSRLQETSIAQPALFALQVALAELWGSWGVEPGAVVGHSVGEVAAAHIAGVLSLENALRIIFQRGRCMDLASSKGKMLGASLPLEQVRQFILGFEDRVSIAAINSPSSVTLSGEAEALNEIAQRLEEQNVFCRLLKVEYAFHSPQMDPVRDELLRSLGGLQPSPATTPIYSTVTGEPATGLEFDAEYWWQNVRQSVRFGPAVAGLIDQGFRIFLELSPHPVLSPYVTECLQEKDQPGHALASLRRRENERFHMLSALGALYTAGYAVDWNKLQHDPGRRVSLPRYPWQHESHWHECESAKETRLGVEPHLLLGRRLKSAEPTWQVQLSPTAFPYLADHKVQGQVVLPAAAYMEIGFAAAKQIFGDGIYVLEQTDLHKAFFLPQGGEPPTLQIVLSQADSSLNIYGRLKKSDPQWVLLATGTIRSEQPDTKKSQPIDWEKLKNNCPEEVAKSTCYQRLEQRGLEYGASFQGIERIWRRDGEAVAIIQVPEHLQLDMENYLVHPAILDAGVHALFETVAESSSSKSEVQLPVQAEQIRFYRRPGPRLWSHVRLVKQGAKTLEGDIRLLDDAGNLLVDIRGLKVQSIDNVRVLDNWMYETKWQLQPRPDAISHYRRADFLPPVEEMEARLQSEADRLSEEFGWRRRYLEVEPELNQLCSAYIVKALTDLGWNPTPQLCMTTDSLFRELGVASQYHRLLGRYLEILAQDGWLKKVGSQWEVCQAPRVVEPVETWRSVLQKFPALYTELMLIKSCGEHLPQVMQGRVDPLHLIFPEGSFTLADHLYQDSPTFKIPNLLVARAISIALEKVPEGRRVRLLEIGAGTAGTTSYVLPELPPEQVDYVFTDVSPLFLQKAAQKLRDYPFVTYQPLNIEKDPTEQGFEPHSYDFILASNVLHATKDLRSTLRHVQKLLASEGLLIFLEADNPSRKMDLVFGLIEGWWRFSDADLRPTYPLLSRERWQTLLGEIGFSKPVAVSEGKREDEMSQPLFMARGPRLEEGAADSPGNGLAPLAAERQKHWLVFADDQGISQQLVEFLRSRGDETFLISPGHQYCRNEDQSVQMTPDRPEDFQRLLNDVVIPNRSVSWGVIYCWSLYSGPPEETTLGSLETSAILGCHGVLHLIQSWSGMLSDEPPQLWLITKGAQPVGRELTSVSVAQYPMCGLGRVIINEHPGFRCRMIDLSPGVSPKEIRSLFEEITGGDDEDEIALRGEARYVPRLMRTSLIGFSKNEKKVVNVTNAPARLEITTPGNLDNITLREAKRRQPGPGEVEIQVSAAALNFRDVMKGLGIYPTNGDDYLFLGDECAGSIVAVGAGVEGYKVGDKVIAVAPQSFGSFVTTKESYVTHKPAHLNFEEASTIPVAFSTAYYGLHYLARIVPGERVLIHAATGGVGLAALQLAQDIGAEVFATAGTPEKRNFLKWCGVQNVMDSRSLLFAEEISDITGGKGVDIVLNSLAGQAIHKGLSCLAPYGRFVEIGTRDIYHNSKLGLRAFKKGLSFFTVNPRIMADQPLLMRRLLDELMQLFKQKRLHPLPHRVFPLGQMVNALRHMAQAKHIGKIVVSVQNQQLSVEPRLDEGISFPSQATYLITGGLGGFGLVVAAWLVDHGARHLVLMGRTGVASDEARSAVEKMKSRGAQVVVAQGDVVQEEDVARVLLHVQQSMPPLRGIVHAAMVLDDGILLQLDPSRFKKVMEPKVCGAWNLHQMTLNMTLDFFVLFSSATTLTGNPGQASYVAANAFLDALAHHRRAQNLPALTINWGRLAETGYVTRHPEVGQFLDRLGFNGFTPAQAMEVLERLLLRKTTHIGVMSMDWRQWSKLASSHSSPRLSLLLSPDLSDRQAREDHGRIRDVILSAPPQDRQQITESYLIGHVAKVLGAVSSTLDREQPLNQMGLDSLTTVELRNRIQKEIGVSLPTVELMRGPSIRSLSRILLDQLTASESSQLQQISPEIQPSQIDGIDGRVAEELLKKVDQLSGQEVDSLLIQLIDETDLQRLNQKALEDAGSVSTSHVSGAAGSGHRQ